jgi:GH15 family glucan-1,4-alpha-glucosidase
VAYKPIRDYGLISDSRTAALVGLDGSIDWLCWPRFDSPSIFGAILDDKKGGCFSVTPTAKYRSSQAYIEDTNVLVTSFETDTGGAELIDFMAVGGTGRHLCRIVKGTSGEIEFEVVFAPRFDYGRTAPMFRQRPDRLSASWTDDTVILAGGAPLRVSADSATGKLRVRAKEKKFLGFGDTNLDVAAGTIEAKLKETVGFWRSWLNTYPYDGPWRRAITRSALTVKALTYQPTGLIVAAPTTSLPEQIGGDKNWDYRYFWLRDAAMVLEAMFHLGHMSDEGARFAKLLVEKGGTDPSELRIMYDIDGNPLGGEEIVPGLKGYMGSTPVRIGNAASEQFQLDVFGEALLCVHHYFEMSGNPTEDVWGATNALADFIAANWKRPDRGIWEERGKPRHYTHSKMMGAVGLQSALAIQRQTGFPAPTERWNKALAAITTAILERAYSPELNSFTKAFDSAEVDASSLLMSVYDFLPAADARLRSTADRIIHTLGHKGLIYRFQWNGEALGVSEGAFAIASIWLAIHFIKLGQLDFAAEYIQAIVESANHLGLLAEEIDAEGNFLGNFPQLFVHTALIDAAHAFTVAAGAQARGT